MKRRLKILIFVIGIILLCGSIAFITHLGGREKTKLSELSEDECIRFLTDRGISIPKGLKAPTIQEMISDLEADPDRPPLCVDWTLLADFYEEVREAVREYDGAKP